MRSYLLELKDDGTACADGGLIRLPAPFEPYLLRFKLHVTSYVRHKAVFRTNLPPDGATFQREASTSFPIETDVGKDAFIEVPVNTAGTFTWQIDYVDENRQPQSTPESHFIVDPALQLNGRPISLDALAVQSIVPKWMGKIDAWAPHLKYISQEKRYNMVHFCPLQQRGKSDSPYSLYDQHSFSEDLFSQINLEKPARNAQVASMVESMEKEYQLLSLTDVVWNHTACDSDWLNDHPEAGFNLHNSPHLYAAYALDTALLELSRNLSKFGLPTELRSTNDLLLIMEAIKSRVLGEIKLWEFYILDTQKVLRDLSFEQELTGSPDIGSTTKDSNLKDLADMCLRMDMVPSYSQLGDRFSKQVDLKVCAAIFNKLCETEDEKCSLVARVLDEINLRFYQEHNSDQDAFMEQLFNRIKYVRLDSHGPGQGPITAASPLIESYFTRLDNSPRTVKHPKGSLALANNGWMWAANPLENFAGPQSKAYLRREVIVWGDCVKLRYGQSPEDNPYLWEHMRQYTVQMAQIFHGFRIDNCHSTPIPVALYLLDEARKVRPNLYTVAELFTGSEQMDLTFVKSLGLSSLLREAMQAWSPDELSRLVHKYGPYPIGSLRSRPLTAGEQEEHVQSSDIHALFFDCTHDNEMPAQKRTAQDTLPNAALVAMTASAIGSVYGYDEIYPEILDLVGEARLYSDDRSGLASIKGLLNSIHREMGDQNWNEAHVHHEGNFITVHRINPDTLQGYFLIAHTAFGDSQDQTSMSPICLNDTTAELVTAVSLKVHGEKPNAALSVRLEGLQSEICVLSEPDLSIADDKTVITLTKDFPPGAIALYKTRVHRMVEDGSRGLTSYLTLGARESLTDCTLLDLNALLYRCGAEEQDTTGEDVYEIPGYGKLVYAGLQGWMAPIDEVLRQNALGHPLCNHLRSGHWALEFIVARQMRYVKHGYHALMSPTVWLEDRLKYIQSSLPIFLAPRAFILVVSALHDAAVAHAVELFSKNVQRGASFAQQLALCSIQMQGRVESASLHPGESMPCMAAGLPHFSTSWARCWGRDIFIAMRGLLLTTGRFAEAESHLLAFATTLKHGMIPNLLDSIRTPRYNSRDSIWFYMQAIQDYVLLVPNGGDILDKQVKRRFPLDDDYVEWDDPRAYAHESSVRDIIQETLQRHAAGLHFREANAGPNLDMQMFDKGFDIDVDVDWSTGLLYGGSQYNCGTWMDKMGESERAGSKGVPGTPRDGAAVEIIGLLKSTLRWVIDLNKQGVYPYKGVQAQIDGTETFVTFVQWNELIQTNFERCFYIPRDEADDRNYDVDPQIVNRRGIYKDLHKSGKLYEDYQLRAQVPMAMVVAPELFQVDHALSHLRIADEVLRGPLGMATLDPVDLNYRPYYNNSEDSGDFHTSKGRNYHQGPEWVFPVGYFLRAWLIFETKKGIASQAEIFSSIFHRISAHRVEIGRSPWAGLTELTNKAGSLCGDSSPTQAWSSGTLLDVIHDMQTMGTQS